MQWNERGNRMPTKTMIKHLDVELTQEEWKLRGREHGDILEQIAELDAEKKRQAEAYKEQLGKLEARRGELVRILRAGAEKRPIECEIEQDFARGVHLVWRTDKERGEPGALVEKIPMTSEERQVSLPLPKGAKQQELPTAPETPALPGKACEGCSMADGNHHPDCTVVNGEPEEPVEPAPPAAEITEDGELVHHMQLPAAVQPKTRIGFDGEGREHAITEAEAEAFFAGKAVFVTTEDGENVDVVRVTRPTPPSPEDDAPPSSDVPDVDYSEAAQIAAEQVEAGAAPEVEADAALEAAMAKDKKRASRRGLPKGV